MADSVGQEVTGEDFAPERYPWTPVPSQGVLSEGRFAATERPDDLLSARDAPRVGERHAVIAVGSNGSAAVMHRKMARAGVSTTLAMSIDRYEHLAAGHSAHVSMPGYVAAAPYRCPRCDRSFVTVHVDDDQLEALDATEPNYRRHWLGTAWVYASMWDVLSIDGHPISLRPQTELHATLASADPEFRALATSHPGPSLTEALAHDGSGDPWRQRWRSRGFTRHDGFT